MLGSLETKKLLVLSGIDVEGYVFAMDESAAYAEELENFGADIDGEWLRSCNLGAGSRAMLPERIQLGPAVTYVGAGITLPGNVGLRTDHRSSSQSWCFDAL
jgi:hypothetical protein